MEGTCPDPVQCLEWLTSRPWGKCTICEGSGWASESGAYSSLFCDWCHGSGLAEYDGVGAFRPEDTTPELVARHTAYVAALRDRLETASLILDSGRPACPGCGSDRFANWTRIQVDGIEVLTHDGDLICPGDPAFGGLTGPELASSTEAVAA
ncbi:hypothetical protein AB0I46_19250 [Streptomyces spectabilis]|uniref:hypothetical protein n=2 Tax=Streptomyces spectabilis TaxID=68270 RepID=UPI0033C66A45